jgi:hypothetical protein
MIPPSEIRLPLSARGWSVTCSKLSASRQFEAGCVADSNAFVGRDVETEPIAGLFRLLEV